MDASGVSQPTMNETAFGNRKTYSFGTPEKGSQVYEAYISPITGKSIHIVNTPIGETKEGYTDMQSPARQSMNVVSYPKCPNSRLIDMKNSAWSTKYTMAMHGRVDPNRTMLYTIGPGEAYLVDRTFDANMDLTQLGETSHEGETLLKKTPNKEYVVEIKKYDNQHKNSKSRVTQEMRRKLFDEMTQEHEEVVSSPHKYRR